MPPSPARDAQGRFVGGLDGGAGRGAGRPEQRMNMNTFIRVLAGLEHPSPPRGRNGLPLDR